jgi:hypothetical protein
MFRRTLLGGALAAPALLSVPACVRPAGGAANRSLGHPYKFAVFIGNRPQELADFEKWFGHPMDAVLGYTDGDPGWMIHMSEFLGSARRQILWSIRMWPDDAGIGTMRAVAAGRSNASFRHWAEEILASRRGDADPIYVRTAWELGGEWFPWTALARRDPGAFRAAIQQFARSFKDVSRRFQIVWDFVPDRGPVEQWYPGDGAVDVISQDVYWNPQWSSTDPVVAFRQARQHGRGLDWMENFARQHGKPMAISEWGTTGDAGDTGGTFILEMKKWLDRHPVVYATYWNGGKDTGYDGDLTRKRWPKTEATFRSAFAPVGAGRAHQMP